MAEKSNDEIKAILDHEIRSAIDYDAVDLSDKRARALDYYFGDMADTPPTANRSSVVSKDVKDVIGWMLPGIMRVFTASGNLVEYEPERAGDEKYCDQASDLVQHAFFRENDGWRILYSATHDSLLFGNGIIKQWWDSSPVFEVEQHAGIPESELSALDDDNIEVLEQSESDMDPVLDMAGEPIKFYDIRIRRKIPRSRLRYDVIEPENFLMDKDAVVIEESRFVAHRDEKTRSELLEMGFDREKVNKLPSDSTRGLTEEELERQEDRLDLDDSMDKATDRIELFECYARMDIDGDGNAELIRAWYAGAQGAGELLDWEEWDDENPFDDIPCSPVPHRWDAEGVSDDVMDIQRVKTVLKRQFLDNLYAHNNPQKEVEHGSVLNLDAVFNPKFGQPIFKKRGSPPIQAHDVAFIGDKAVMGLEYMDQVIERRTGVSRSTMALDPDALQNQTATAVQKTQDAALSKQELIARVQAELGWKKVFRKSLRLIIRHQDEVKAIRKRDEWIDVDPRQWNANMDCTVNVGLGTGSRDRDMTMLNQVLQHQFTAAKSMMDYGFPQGAIEYLDKMVKTMVKIGESAGLRNADDFHPEVTPEMKQMLLQMIQQKSQQPDPEIEREKMKMEMQRESKMMDMQMDQQKSQMEAQLRQQEHQLETMLKREELDADIRQDLTQMRAEIALKREQMQHELQLRWHQLQQELGMKRRSQALNLAMGGMSTPIRMGGDPG